MPLTNNELYVTITEGQLKAEVPKRDKKKQNSYPLLMNYMGVNLCRQPLFLNLMMLLSQNLCNIEANVFHVSTFLTQT